MIDWSPGVPVYFTRGARSNTVVNEERQHPITAPPGTYRIIANYQPNNLPDGADTNDQVANLVVAF